MPITDLLYIIFNKKIVLTRMLNSLSHAACPVRMSLNKPLFLLVLQNLSTWKSRRRKQSEEALQRVSEVKALEDEEFGTAKKS